MSAPLGRPRDRDAEKAVVRALDELGYHDQVGMHVNRLKKSLRTCWVIETLLCAYIDIRTSLFVLFAIYVSTYFAVARE